MKKIISLMILLLMVSVVSAKTEEKKFETYITIKTDNAITNEYGTYLGSCTNVTEEKKYAWNITRNVEVEELSNLENITKVMEELAYVSLQLAMYGNDSKDFQTLYNEKNEAWARLCENYDDCKKDRDIYKNDSIQLDSCQTDLANMRVTKSQCDTSLSTCAKDLEDQKANTQTAWIVGILIGAGGVYLFVEYKKKYEPSERDSFQH